MRPRATSSPPALASGGRPIDLEVIRTIGTFPPVKFADATATTDGEVIVRSVPDLAEVADLVDGAWPTGPGEASLRGRRSPRAPGSPSATSSVSRRPDPSSSSPALAARQR